MPASKYVKDLRQFADATLIRETLGFTPRYSDLDTIVRTAAPFFELDLPTRVRAEALS